MNKVSKRNEPLDAQAQLCGFHNVILRLLDVLPSKLADEDLRVLREADDDSWIEQSCSLVRQSCPRHGDWQALRIQEIEDELEEGLKRVCRLRRDGTEIAARLERRMEVSVSSAKPNNSNPNDLIVSRHV